MKYYPAAFSGALSVNRLDAVPDEAAEPIYPP